MITQTNRTNLKENIYNAIEQTRNKWAASSPITRLAVGIIAAVAVFFLFCVSRFYIHHYCRRTVKDESELTRETAQFKQILEKCGIEKPKLMVYLLNGLFLDRRNQLYYSKNDQFFSYFTNLDQDGTLSFAIVPLNPELNQTMEFVDETTISEDNLNQSILDMMNLDLLANTLNDAMANQNKEQFSDPMRENGRNYSALIETDGSMTVDISRQKISYYVVSD